MSKYGRRYPPEFKEEAVRLANQSEKSIAKIAEDFGGSPMKRCVDGYDKQKSIRVSGKG